MSPAAGSNLAPVRMSAPADKGSGRSRGKGHTGAAPPVSCRLVAPLPERMLVRSGPLPRADYANELKWDGFCALVSTVGRLRVLSRQWWEMTPHLPELQALRRGLALDGQLMAFGEDGKTELPVPLPADAPRP